MFRHINPGSTSAMIFRFRAGLISMIVAASLMPASTIAADEAPSCSGRMAAVMAEIASRDLDTSRGPPLNAFLTLNPYAAGEAAALDAAVGAGTQQGPLHCLPIAVKDNFATLDMPMTAGSLALIGNQPPRDAAIVARLRAAGAIIVGKTNMDEFAFGIRGLSGAGGRVGNAYDPTRSSGGSSAGSGVAVGAGFVPLAVGSDNCGSLRIPAVYNGAVALRPTYGRFDDAGLFPIGFVNGTPGLIARDMATLAAGLAVVDPGWQASAATAPDALRGKRLGLLVKTGDESLAPTTNGARRVLAEAAALLRAAGAEVIDDIAIDDFDAKLGAAFVAGSAPRIDAMLSAYPAARRDWADICASGRIPPDWTEEECLSLAGANREAESQASAQIEANRALVIGLLDRRDLDGLVYLTDRRGGARAGETDGFTCFVASTSGLPAMALPGGLDDEGMPAGVEILGRPGSDETLVAMAAALEAARGPLPAAPLPPASAGLAALSIAEQNSLRLFLGWSAFRSRSGDDLGDLEPGRFRALVDGTIGVWPPGQP